MSEFPMDWVEWRREWFEWVEKFEARPDVHRYRGDAFPGKNFLSDEVLGRWSVAGRPVELSEVTFSVGTPTRRVGVTFGGTGLYGCGTLAGSWDELGALVEVMAAPIEAGQRVAVTNRAAPGMEAVRGWTVVSVDGHRCSLESDAGGMAHGVDVGVLVPVLD